MSPNVCVQDGGGEIQEGAGPFSQAAGAALCSLSNITQAEATVTPWQHTFPLIFAQALGAGGGWTGRPWAAGFQQRLLRTKGSESFPLPEPWAGFLSLFPLSPDCPEMSRPMAGPLSARAGRAVSNCWAHRHLLSTCCVPGSILRARWGKGAG